jgi:hypothetical protein
MQSDDQVGFEFLYRWISAFMDWAQSGAANVLGIALRRNAQLQPFARWSEGR